MIGMRVVILIGPSGAGKSTYISNTLRNAGGKGTICSADHFFIDPNGSYNFNPSKLGLAHAECLKAYIQALMNPEDDFVFVDNTNTTKEDLAPYIAVARAYGYEPEIVVLGLDIDPATLAGRNLHGVPEASCRRMQDNVRRMMNNWPRHWPALR